MRWLAATYHDEYQYLHGEWRTCEKPPELVFATSFEQGWEKAPVIQLG